MVENLENEHELELRLIGPVRLLRRDGSEVMLKGRKAQGLEAAAFGQREDTVAVGGEDDDGCVLDHRAQPLLGLLKTILLMMRRFQRFTQCCILAFERVRVRVRFGGRWRFAWRHQENYRASRAATSTWASGTRPCASMLRQRAKI